MTSQTPEETHNTEVEDVADELLWSLTPKSNCGCGGYLDYDDSRTKILETLHHQLQKARHDWLREEIVKLKQEQKDMGTKISIVDYYKLGYFAALQTIIDRYQSELGQEVSK